MQGVVDDVAYTSTYIRGRWRTTKRAPNVLRQVLCWCRWTPDLWNFRPARCWCMNACAWV